MDQFLLEFLAREERPHLQRCQPIGLMYSTPPRLYFSASWAGGQFAEVLIVLGIQEPWIQFW